MTIDKRSVAAAACILLACAALLASHSDVVTYGLREVARRASEGEEETPKGVFEHFVKQSDSAASIWIVNQPKCGTGSIEKSVTWGLNCELADMAPYQQEMDKIQVPLYYKTRTFECPDNRRVFRSHSKDSGLVKAAVDASFPQRHDEERCLVITAVRNPLLSIPSLFFEENKARYCDGAQSEEEVLADYEKFLGHNGGPPRQVETTAHVLKEFGVRDIAGAMDRLTGRGYAFFREPAADGPWAGCELLFLQIDYDEANSNLDIGLDHAVEGISMLPLESRQEICPKAAVNYRAMIEHEIKQEHIDRFDETHPEMGVIISYYKKLRRERKE